jgi:hypothetical protein
LQGSSQHSANSQNQSFTAEDAEENLRRTDVHENRLVRSAGLQAGVPDEPGFGLLGWETGCRGSVHAGTPGEGVDGLTTAGLETSATCFSMERSEDLLFCFGRQQRSTADPSLRSG